jgi:hypothetical protein
MIRRARGFRFGFWGVVAVTLLPGLLFPVTFFSALSEFWKVSVQLPPSTRRSVRVADRVEYYLKRKWSSIEDVLAYNTSAERFPAERFWADDEIHIDIPSVRLDALSEDLPLSAEQYQKMNLWHNGRYHRARLRYRGNSGWHWLFEKKSLKIRTSKRRLYHGHRTINLTVKYPYVSTATHLLARRFELMAPHSAPVRIFVNNEFYGIERFMEEIDEGFLRREGRLPGDIYKGEGVRATNEFHYGTPGDFLLRVPYVWPKIAVDNSQPEEQRDALVSWSRAINTPEPASLAELEAFLDLDTTARHLAFNILLGEFHCRDTNNLKWYLDPTDGRFYPILWDIYARGNKGIFVEGADRAYSIVNHATHQLLRDPRLLQEALAYLYERLDEPGLIESVIDPLEEFTRTHAAAVAVDQGNPQFPSDLANLNVCRERLLGGRTRALEFIAKGTIAYAQSGTACVLGTDAAAGALLESLTLSGSQLADVIEVVLDLNRDGNEGDGEPRVELVHEGDGRFPIPDPLTILPGLTGPNRLVPRPIPYVLLLPESLQVVDLQARNSITDAPMESQRVEELKRVPLDVVHPWDRPIPEPVIWDWPAEVRSIDRDFVVPEHVTLRIAAGTRLRIAPGASLYIFGRILAEGTSQAPVVFESSEPGNPWGALALQGGSADGSRLRHTEFRGGSLARHARVRYPGMVNVHHASDVRFENCLFEENLIGDDALRTAHAVVDVVDCTFSSIASDAIDYDHSSGRIVGNRFLDTGNDGIDLMTSDPWIEGNDLRGCGDKGISIGEGARPTVVNNRIEACAVGIQSKDWADPLILHCDIVDCVQGVDAYRKNWRYGEGGRGRLVNCRLIGNHTAVTVDDRSRLILESCLVEGALKGPPDRIVMRDCSTDSAQEPAVYAELSARFEVDPFPEAIGLREELTLRPRPVLLEQLFEDGIAPSHRGWRIEGGVKLYIEDRCLRAGLGRPGQRLVHRELGVVGGGERRLHLDLSAAQPATVIVELADRELVRVELDTAPRSIFADLPEGETGELSITSTVRTTIRVHSAVVTN